MTNTKPHFGNLQKRAKALGFEVTRMSTDEDARAVGHHEYVMIPQGASGRTKDNARLHSLCGIRAIIEGKELNVESQVVTDSCGNVVKPSDPDYKEARDEMRGKTVPVFRNSPFEYRVKAAEALESLNAARIVGAEQVLTVMDKYYWSGTVEQIKEEYKSQIESLVAHEARKFITFSESERVSHIDSMTIKTDTHIVGKLVVMPEAVLNDVLTLLNRIAR